METELLKVIGGGGGVVAVVAVVVLFLRYWAVQAVAAKDRDNQFLDALRDFQERNEVQMSRLADRFEEIHRADQAAMQAVIGSHMALTREAIMAINSVRQTVDSSSDILDSLRDSVRGLIDRSGRGDEPPGAKAIEGRPHHRG